MEMRSLLLRRGGEVWNGIAWVETSKESVKEDFKLGKVRILICTDSASEGLNLQTCGVLINYDMPWNPMRVEQRIGRIDRIGQEFPEVWISNYFYKDTIEDQIYFRHGIEFNGLKLSLVIFSPWRKLASYRRLACFLLQNVKSS
jgi:SNF2 family DNA or RNA helicase